MFSENARAADGPRGYLLSASLPALLAQAAALRDEGHGALVSYSPNVFIPLTRLCRDVCHYCTFAKSPSRLDKLYLEPEDVLAIARAGAAAGCHEALFTLGDKPELRWPQARAWLDARGYASTIAYLAAMCELVLKETGLLPHVNCGTATRIELEQLRVVSASQGLMLETVSERLCGKGQVHHGSPDKLPAARLETIRLAGELAIPYTSGILIGIGETREERVDSLLALKELHDRYGHLQELIIQNLKVKDDTRLAGGPEPDLSDLQWTVAVARIVFGPAMNIQAPPNLNQGGLPQLLAAGANDWGGVSPVTVDHVNPECPWPELEVLRSATAAERKVLVPRLAVYPAYAMEPRRWLAAPLRAPVLRLSDGQGFGREDGWVVGEANQRHPRVCGDPGPASELNAEDAKVTQRNAEESFIPVFSASSAKPLRPLRSSDIRMPWVPASAGMTGGSAEMTELLERARKGQRLDPSGIVTLFEARGPDFHAVCAAADALRREVAGGTVTYAVNRNINYTNVCGYKCRFCAFSKGRLAENLAGDPYDLPVEEVVRRAREAWERGATEVCLQGGIHPDYTGETYLALTRAIKAALPDMHIHAFSPLEVTQGARTLGLEIVDYLQQLQRAGLASLPGTAAEILSDDVRAELCPDKLDTQQWLSVVETAHRVGLRTTATIMFGHIEQYRHWAAHLLAIRDLQARTGGFTEFVPLPFVAAEAPLYRKGGARRGPTLREAILMHAVARLALHPLIPNIQASWVKMGAEGVKLALAAGANDLGGTLMNESISRAAGAAHGQELPPAAMDALIRAIGREPRQRSTLYGAARATQVERSYRAAPLAPTVEPRAGKFARTGSARAARIPLQIIQATEA
ncbi:MAG TPA: bifunctional FO biosynthesis protein CofGH [Ramlibacter sp.]|nr:bifunctional FO biosynthesis protein CofGH [Ramlibacter sp.]